MDNLLELQYIDLYLMMFFLLICCATNNIGGDWSWKNVWLWYVFFLSVSSYIQYTQQLQCEEKKN